MISAQLGEFLSGEYVRVGKEIKESSSLFPLEQLLEKYTLHYKMAVGYDPPSDAPPSVFRDFWITIMPDGGLDIQGTTPGIIPKLGSNFESPIAYKEVFAYMLDMLQGLPGRPLDRKAIARQLGIDIKAFDSLLDEGLQGPEDQKG